MKNPTFSMARENTNYGYITEHILDGRDFIFGGYSGVDNVILNPTGDWFAWLPPLEVQNDDWGDTYSCVSFAMTNAIEVILKKKYGVDINFSERALAKMSGTKRTGNTMSAVAETIRTQGLIPEKDWPLDYENCSSWEDFYKDIPADILAKASDFLDEYEVKWEWLFDHTKIKEALQYAPLVCAIYAYPPQENGLYQKYSAWPNHNVLLYSADTAWRFYDNYKNSYKNYTLDYEIGAIVKFDITLKSEKPMPKWTFDNNTLLNLVEGGGGWGLYLDGKVIVDNLDKLLATWLTRNNGNVTNKVRAVTMEIWSSFPKINLRREDI